VIDGEVMPGDGEVACHPRAHGAESDVSQPHLRLRFARRGSLRAERSPHERAGPLRERPAVSVLSLIAAVTARAFDVAAELVPAGVDVRWLPDGRDTAAFVLLDWDDDETTDALPELTRLRVLQTLSAGTDWIEERVPAWASLCNARGTRDAAVAEWVVGA